MHRRTLDHVGEKGWCPATIPDSRFPEGFACLRKPGHPGQHLALARDARAADYLVEAGIERPEHMSCFEQVATALSLAHHDGRESGRYEATPARKCVCGKFAKASYPCRKCGAADPTTEALDELVRLTEESGGYEDE